MDPAQDYKAILRGMKAAEANTMTSFLRGLPSSTEIVFVQEEDLGYFAEALNESLWYESRKSPTITTEAIRKLPFWQQAQRLYKHARDGEDIRSVAYPLTDELRIPTPTGEEFYGPDGRLLLGLASPTYEKFESLEALAHNMLTISLQDLILNSLGTLRTYGNQHDAAYRETLQSVVGLPDVLLRHRGAPLKDWLSPLMKEKQRELADLGKRCGDETVSFLSNLAGKIATYVEAINSSQS